MTRPKILVKGISAADAHAAAQRMLIADPSLAHLSPLLSPCLLWLTATLDLVFPLDDAFILHGWLILYLLLLLRVPNLQDLLHQHKVLGQGVLI